MIEKIIEQISKADTIAVLAHIGEDPDAVASCFAMREMLRVHGKNSTCYFSEKIKKGLDFLNGEYVIYVPEDEITCDLCICLDCGDLQRLGERVKIFENSKVTMNIDHHYTNTNFADINWVEADAAATGEVLYKLFCKMGQISQIAAKCLYTAIAADTGCFKYSNVSPTTLRITADLLEYKISHADITKQLFDTEELSVIRLKAEIASNVKTYYDGKLNIVVVDSELFEKYDVAENAVGDFVDIPRRIEGTEVAICIKKYSNKAKISMRSNGNVNVAEIAKKLGGGGHKMAAGAALETTIEEAEKVVLEMVKHVI